MITKTMQVCTDIGSVYCPCHLAYTGDCILCPMIQGKNKCDCQWQGVCVYNNYLKSLNTTSEERHDILCDIINKQQVGENLYLLEISIPRKLCIELIHPGSYVLLRYEHSLESKFNAPISVMDIDEQKGILKVVIKCVGVKTKNILNSDKVWLRAPFRNGIFGIKELKLTSNSNTMIIASGLSQVTILKVIKQLLKNNNKVEVFIDSQKYVIDEVVRLTSLLGMNVQIIDYSQDEDMIKDYIIRNNVKLVYSGASSKFSKQVMNMIDSIDNSIRLVIANNNLINCGEGICGACTIKVNGIRVKSCKAQIDPRVYLREVLS